MIGKQIDRIPCLRLIGRNGRDLETAAGDRRVAPWTSLGA
jgi:hypothetical protein